MWTIIKRYQVAEVVFDGLTGKEALFLWCHQSLARYDISVTNFTTNWSNGLAFCALIHAHHPQHIPYETLNEKKDKENLSLAFNVLETHFQIPSLLQAEDFQSHHIDEKVVLTYMSLLFQVLVFR